MEHPPDYLAHPPELETIRRIIRNKRRIIYVIRPIFYDICRIFRNKPKIKNDNPKIFYAISGWKTFASPFIVPTQDNPCQPPDLFFDITGFLKPVGLAYVATRRWKLTPPVFPRELALVSTQATPTGVLMNTYRHVGSLRSKAKAARE